ncbi:MAG: hypothetical protein EOM83_02465 [Clostridia bacterium]|nr:hypothetical protein [Clostridia bacterium]
MKGQKENNIFTRHESRHSNRPNVFYFLPIQHFFETILTSRTNGTFAFAQTQIANPSAKSKEPFLSQCSIYFIFE